MSSVADQARVENNPDGSRYEIRLGGRLAGFAAYRERGDVLVFTHTEVEPDLKGSGIGGRLVGAALDDVRAQGRKLVAICPFVAAYLRRHPEYADLVAEGGS